LLVPGFRLNDVWTPAPVPDADPGFAGVTAWVTFYEPVIIDGNISLRWFKINMEEKHVEEKLEKEASGGCRRRLACG
jgi:hypothetical protein